MNQFLESGLFFQQPENKAALRPEGNIAARVRLKALEYAGLGLDIGAGGKITYPDTEIKNAFLAALAVSFDGTQSPLFYDFVRSAPTVGELAKKIAEFEKIFGIKPKP